MTVAQWLAVILQGITLDQGAISALSLECTRRYDLNAAAAAGYDTNRLIALYVAAHLAPAKVLGVSKSGKALKSRREGKVSETFATESTTKAGWEGTTWGQEFKDAIDDSGSGVGLMIGHAD